MSNWIAKDENGKWWRYTRKPIIDKVYRNWRLSADEGGTFFSYTASSEESNIDWRQSLKKVER